MPLLDSDAKALLDREIDDLLLDLRGLALVRDILIERGASGAEIAAHGRELERSRARLAELIRGPGHADDAGDEEDRDRPARARGGPGVAVAPATLAPAADRGGRAARRVAGSASACARSSGIALDSHTVPRRSVPTAKSSREVVPEASTRAPSSVVSTPIR